jgi:hypothetical protein
MKQLLFSLFILFSGSLIGQEETPKPINNDFKRFRIGVSYAPEMSYRDMVNVDGSTASSQAIDVINEFEIIKYGFTTGISGSYNISPRTGFEIGVMYSNKGYQDKKMEYSMITSTGDYVVLGKYKSVFTFNYIDIPLKVNFTFGQRKVHLLASAGLVTNLFISSSQTDLIKFNDDSEKRTKVNDLFHYTDAMVSAMLGTGIDYSVNSRLTLRLEPRFRYGLTRVIDNKPISARLWDFGINVGCYVGF